MTFFYLVLSIFISIFMAKIAQSPDFLVPDPTFWLVFLSGIAAALFYIYFRHKKNGILKNVRAKDSLSHLTWQEYEQLCNEYLLSRGVTANLSKAGADGGIDIHAQWKGKKIIVQCKHWKSAVGVSTVREMFGLLHEQSAASIIIFSSSRFTKPAWDFAKGKPIYLVTGEKLLQEIHKS